MRLNGKKVDLRQLRDELEGAGIPVPALGTLDDDLHTYDEDGAIVALPAEAAAVLAAHVPAPPKPTPAEAAAAVIEKAGTLAELKAALAPWVRAQK